MVIKQKCGPSVTPRHRGAGQLRRNLFQGGPATRPLTATRGPAKASALARLDAAADARPSGVNASLVGSVLSAGATELVSGVASEAFTAERDGVRR